MTTFALIGAAGFVAPRHMQAIHDVGGDLVAACDPHDSVGVLDQFGFKNTDFFTSPERFERYLAKMAHTKPLDWLIVCSPNYLHDTHIRMGLNVGARVLCEKPLVLSPDNLNELSQTEGACDSLQPRVFTVLQLRHVIALRDLKVHAWPPHAGGHAKIELVYTTPRGRWYNQSWKGDVEKSGGLITNIGIHMLDMLLWIWGSSRSAVHWPNSAGTATRGRMELERADVHFALAIDGDKPERKLIVDGHEIDFTTGFENLHKTVYRETLAGRGHTIADARPAIELAWLLRNNVNV